ncbi:hypothetical protein [Wolbachia endosymbiont (group A) of Brachyopa scutellaris]|uniref:hypothetical protein n=1 Tax=Wolbachia endosymbiont (group A) of Brachyopa scutellaris TaxID=3066140 RepID=UPI00313350DA
MSPQPYEHYDLSSPRKMSFQRVTLESSLYYAATWLKLSLLDPSSLGTGVLDRNQYQLLR